MFVALVRRYFPMRRTGGIKRTNPRPRQHEMLVIASDLHLTDGSLGETLSPGAVELFAQRLQELAVAASWRADGSYRPMEQIDIVLLGDILDVIHSGRWSTRPNVRPWVIPAPRNSSTILPV